MIGRAGYRSQVERALKRSPVCALLGPRQCGKTTLARIAAKELNCTEVIEIDAATNTGVDDMRRVCATLPYIGFGGGHKAVVVDECHRLSAAAWSSLLKVLEEPPSHVYWMLCTTEADKIAKTIRTRCVAYDLKPLDEDEIRSYLLDICGVEGFTLDEGAVDLIVDRADGSMRQALVSLSLCAAAKDRATVAQLLQTAQSSKEVIDLCRFLINPQGRTWQRAVKILKDLDGQSPESVRIVVLQYLTKVAMGAKGDAVIPVLYAMEQFAKPFNHTDKLAPLVLAVGAVIYGD